MPVLDDHSANNNSISQLSGGTCDIHMSDVEHLAKSFPELSDWQEGSLRACTDCSYKLNAARTQARENCLKSLDEVSRIYSGMVVNKSTLKPRDGKSDLWLKLEQRCHEPSSDLDFEGQVWFEVPVSEHGSGADTLTKITFEKFLTDFDGPLAQCLRNAKEGFKWDKPKDEVSYADSYLIVHPKWLNREYDSALVTFRRTQAVAKEEDDSDWE
jgi:hypothetical protein